MATTDGSTVVNIVWFRQDLRMADNPALDAACEAGSILPIYILDDVNAGEHAMGDASRVWLHHALVDLNRSLNGKLHCFKGDARKVIGKLASQLKVEGVYWNRCYEPWRIDRDSKIKEALQQQRIAVHSFNGSLLWEPWTVLKQDGTPYKVFTPFYRKGCLSAVPPRQPMLAPEKISFARVSVETMSVDELELLPSISWDQPMLQHWDISEAGAQATLASFMDERLVRYKQGRDFPAVQGVSRLSPYLHFGQVSPHQLWAASLNREQTNNTDTFQSELGWREFSHSLLYHFPALPQENLQEKFNRFPWKKNPKHLSAWQQGMTGYPIVDAGMRELWQTGYMHNRVRMITGSFLVKNLLLDWREGEAWFWDCLFDADLANNSASWQWVAGCGADAAPYFRIFNPVTQGEKFDDEGKYTRRFVSELKDLPDKYLFKPWEAPESVLKEAGVVLGKTYPKPVVDLKASRERALQAFQQIKTPAD